MKATLKDIAADTGFSVTTVSLVLNNKPSKIPEGTKQIILEAAQRLGYRPNQLAVSLVKKRTDTLGLIVSDVSNPFFSTLAKGVEDICRENGCNMILCNTNNMHKCDLDYINMLVDKGVDGIIYGMAGDSTLKNAIDSCNLMKEQDMSFVIIDRYFKKLHTSYIGVDHLMGGYYATKHLIEMGHKKIACITGPLHLDDVLERLKGYKKALKEAGIKYDSKLVFEGRYNMESGAAAFPWLMKTKCTAVFAFNDMTAYGLYIEAKKNGVSIPKDFSVVGYDDIYFSKILEAPLTTIKQPVYEMGVKATEILIEAIKNKKRPEEQFVYQPELIVRSSTRKFE
ncbi:LacI family DNA-binding transcriptional regulator [Clostridium culturomicium]|uniref:LacI family DNA-binding transcriptional regulator n=1 Tax=Clostridium culturomicium TaxID=1499683 RepID=UPI000590C854|nr:LacI family DNA-binding transcriptional regulator [Clostridium culturomicium]